MKDMNWKKRGGEFLSIFVAVISAFALNNWNDNRRNENSENKILVEISNGLEKDLDDIQLNVEGHKQGIAACNFFRKAIVGKDLRQDSLMIHYFNLTRDFVSIQNRAGYESLKSKGLELIQDDFLRLKIISLYEYDYQILQKLEEEYAEMQFFNQYFKEINTVIAPNIKRNEAGMIMGFQSPLEMEESKRSQLLLFLWKIQSNRLFILRYYTEISEKIEKVRKSIGKKTSTT